MCRSVPSLPTASFVPSLARVASREDFARRPVQTVAASSLDRVPSCSSLAVQQGLPVQQVVRAFAEEGNEAEHQRRDKPAQVFTFEQQQLVSYYSENQHAWYYGYVIDSDGAGGIRVSIDDVVRTVPQEKLATHLRAVEVEPDPFA